MVKSDRKSIDEPSVGVISEKLLRDKIYTIREKEVMLDYDLAEIYGYTTSAFNQQVKNNIEKFEGEDFMFQLNKHDLESISISENLISMQTKGVRGGRAKMPYAFTEQGIYMLITVLRGELAVKQSRALIRIFKAMKDYVKENKALTESREQLRIASTTMENTQHIAKIESELSRVDERLSIIENKAEDMLTKSDISPILLDFGKVAEQREYVFLDGEPLKASELFTEIYASAKKSVYVIDNYASIKTLRHLQSVKVGVEIVVFSDNIGGYLHKVDYVDFRRERDDIEVKFIRTEGLVHDRFIVVDYGTKDEAVYHCGASEKDAGKRLMMISKLEGVIVKIAIREAVERLMGNEELELR